MKSVGKAADYRGRSQGRIYRRGTYHLNKKDSAHRERMSLRNEPS